jgi:hypothetical protein
MAAFDIARGSATVALLQEALERLEQRGKLLQNAYGVEKDDNEDKEEEEEESRRVNVEDNINEEETVATAAKRQRRN